MIIHSGDMTQTIPQTHRYMIIHSGDMTQTPQLLLILWIQTCPLSE